MFQEIKFGYQQLALPVTVHIILPVLYYHMTATYVILR